MSLELLTEHRLEFLSLKGGCTGSSESTTVKMPHFWKSHIAAQLSFRQHAFSKRHTPVVTTVISNSAKMLDNKGQLEFEYTLILTP